MRNASRAPRSALRQPTPTIAHGLAEKRPEYSENSTAPRAHADAAKATSVTPTASHRLPDVRARLRRVAFCSHGRPRTPTSPCAQQAPTWRTVLPSPRR